MVDLWWVDNHIKVERVRERVVIVRWGMYRINRINRLYKIYKMWINNRNYNWKMIDIDRWCKKINKEE